MSALLSISVPADVNDSFDTEEGISSSFMNVVLGSSSSATVCILDITCDLRLASNINGLFIYALIGKTSVELNI